MATKYIGDTWSVAWGDILSNKVVVSYSIDGGEQVVIEAEAPNGEDYTGEYDWVINLEENASDVVLRVADSVHPEYYVEFGSFDIEERALTFIVVSPSATRIAPTKTRQFTAVALDQTETALDVQPAITWSTDAEHGSISATGLFTAGEVEEKCTVTATSGEVEGEASVTVLKVTANTRASCRIGIGL